MPSHGSPEAIEDPSPWTGLPDRLRARGLRWTPQRRILVEVLSRTDGHVTGAELVERCRAVDPGTIPSTVYRTLDVLEELGVVSHSHGVDGREEFHVLPPSRHGHLYCTACGGEWDLTADDPEVTAAIGAFDAGRGFALDITHLTLVGRCAGCRGGPSGGASASSAPASTAPASSTRAASA